MMQPAPEGELLMPPPLAHLFPSPFTTTFHSIFLSAQEGLLTMAVPEDRPEVAALVPKISIPVVLVTKARLPSGLPIMLGGTELQRGYSEYVSALQRGRSECVSVLRSRTKPQASYKSLLSAEHG